MERSGERLFSCDGLVAQPGQPAQHHIDLDLRPGGRSGRHFAQQTGQYRGGDSGQHELAPNHMLGTHIAVMHRAVWGDGENVGIGRDFGTRTGRSGGQTRGHRAHAANGNVPVAGAPTEHVVQETDVLPQRFVIETSERADQRIGGDHAADQVIAHRGGDGPPDRLLDHGPPHRRRLLGGTVEDVASGLLAGPQRFQQRRPQPFGQQPAASVERVEPLLVARGTDRGEGGLRADQQAGATGCRRIRGV